MENTLVGIFFIVFGIILITFYKTFGRRAIEQQNKLFGFHFGEREIQGTQLSFVIAGIIFLIIGILSLFQMIRFIK